MLRLQGERKNRPRNKPVKRLNIFIANTGVVTQERFASFRCFQIFLTRNTCEIRAKQMKPQNNFFV